MKNNMKIIALSLDHALIDPNSAVFRRMQRYGAFVERIDVIALGVENPQPSASQPAAGVAGDPIQLEPNVFVHAVGTGSRIAQFFRALALARKLASGSKQPSGLPEAPAANDPKTLISVQDPFESGIWGLLAAMLCRARLHVQVHIDFFSPHFWAESARQRFQAAMAPFVLRRAHSIRVVSEKLARYVHNELGIDSRKIVIAPVYVDIGSIKSAPITVDLHALYLQFDPIVLVACRFVKQKNVPLAIEAFEIFKKQQPKAGLVIVGSGREQEAIEKLVKERDLTAAVKIGGWTKEFASCMKTCDMFLMSSDYEGWGMTVVEAAALGKPIVMTDVGCAGEFLLNDVNGQVVPVRDPEAMAAALERYAKDRAYGRRMGQEASLRAGSYMSRDENDALVRKSWSIADAGGATEFAETEDSRATSSKIT